MKNILPFAMMLLLVSACSKNGNSPSNNTNSTSGTNSGAVPVSPKSAITVNINEKPMLVTGVSFNRSSGTFNFTAENSLQKVDFYCYHFYEPNWANYMYSDSINYSSRNNSLADWNTITAKRIDGIYFNCCAAPLIDAAVDGYYKADFYNGKEDFIITGDFKGYFK